MCVYEAHVHKGSSPSAMRRAGPSSKFSAPARTSKKVVSLYRLRVRHRHHVDFIKTFTQREAQKRANQKPQRLDPSGPVALRQQVGQVQFIVPDYADCTKVNMTGILGKWQLYFCFNTGKLGDCKPGAWKASMTNAK